MELIFLAELIISDATLLIELCRISIEFMFDTDKPKELPCSGQVILSVLLTHLEGSWFFPCLVQ